VAGSWQGLLARFRAGHPAWRGALQGRGHLPHFAPGLEGVRRAIPGQALAGWVCGWVRRPGARGQALCGRGGWGAGGWAGLGHGRGGDRVRCPGPVPSSGWAARGGGHPSGGRSRGGRSRPVGVAPGRGERCRAAGRCTPVARHTRGGRRAHSRRLRAQWRNQPGLLPLPLHSKTGGKMSSWAVPWGGATFAGAVNCPSRRYSRWEHATT
jgi:hypothetical protein